jgi:hypothetical protein
MRVQEQRHCGAIVYEAEVGTVNGCHVSIARF